MRNDSENKHLYQDGWNTIYDSILERAHHHCEFCGVTEGLCVTDGQRWYPVRLSIAYLDHDWRNNNPSNLRALCQRCYEKYNANYHALTNDKPHDHKDQSLDIPFDY